MALLLATLQCHADTAAHAHPPASALDVHADADTPVLAGPAFSEFVRHADAHCPVRRLRLITPGDLDWLQAGYTASLTPQSRATLAAADPGERRCAGSPGGLSCPTEAKLEALHATKRMPAFAVYACAHRPPGGAVTATATATTESPRVFADTCVTPDSSDVAGHIVAVSEGASGPTAPTVAFVWSEGALMAPVTTKAAYDPRTRQLDFTLRAPPGTFTFRGRLQAHRLTGRLTSPGDTVARKVTLTERAQALAEAPTRECPLPAR